MCAIDCGPRCVASYVQHGLVTVSHSLFLASFLRGSFWTFSKSVRTLEYFRLRWPTDHDVFNVLILMIVALLPTHTDAILIARNSCSGQDVDVHILGMNCTTTFALCIYVGVFIYFYLENLSFRCHVMNLSHTNVIGNSSVCRVFVKLWSYYR